MLDFEAAPPPNGRIVFVSDGDLYLMAADGSDVQRLTQTPQEEDDPAGSPDGQRIAFTRNRNIWVMNVDGTQPRRLTSLGKDADPAWSPNGRMIFFSRSRKTADGLGAGILRMRDDGRQVQRLTNPRYTCDTDPAPSPDGRTLAYTGIGDCERGGTIVSIHAIGVNGRASGVLDRLWEPTSAFSFDPDWAPNGRLLTFAVHDLRGLRVNRGGIYVGNVNGARARRVTAMSWRSWNGQESPSWSGDGEWLAFVSDVSLPRSSPGEIFIVRRDGTGLRRLTNTETIDDHDSDWVNTP